MDRAQIRRQLYQKYIEPTKVRRRKYIGIEIEMPVVNLSGGATDYALTQAAAAAFCRQFGFLEEKFDDNGVCYSASCPQTGDNLSFDCAYNNMELSLGKEVSLDPLNARFQRYVSFLNGFLEKEGHLLTGLGINPNRAVNRRDYIPTERYRMLEHYLLKYKDWDVPQMRFHPYPDFGAFSSASQVQLDIDYEDLISVLKGQALLEPVKAVLFANSLMDEEPHLLCVRDMLWENSTHGINPHNIGMFEYGPDDADDLLEYICTTSIFCTMRDGHYLCFYPVPIMDYLEADEIRGEMFRDGTWQEMTFAPQSDDLAYLRTYKHEDLTYRGTIEFRSACCQPFSEAMCVAAFHMGLVQKADELTELLENDRVLYHHGYGAPEMRKLMSQRYWPSFIDRGALSDLCCSVLDLASEGLRQIGYGDEKYLAPLYHRARTLVSPAREMREALEKGVPMETIVRRYAALT